MPSRKDRLHTLRILVFIGAHDVPVAAGCVRPLARLLVLGIADGPSGLEGSPYLPPATKKPEPMHAVDRQDSCASRRSRCGSSPPARFATSACSS